MDRPGLARLKRKGVDTMLDRIKKRVETNYEHQQIFLMRDLRFLLKFAEIEMHKAEKYS